MSTPLFSLQITHGWYADGRLRGWTLEACPETRVIMRRHGLRWQASQSACTLFAAPGSDPAAYLAALVQAGNDAPLRFRFQLDQQHLARITDLPAGLRGMPDFSSRQCRLEPAAGGAIRQLLAQVPDCGAREARGDLLLYPSDLALALPEGQWRIGFAARALPWMYYIVNRGQFPLHQPVLRSDDGLCLDGPESITLANGESALRFDSGEVRLPFQQAACSSFSLYDNLRSPLSAQCAEICLMRTLPVPQPDALAWADSGQQRRIYAAVHVYL